MTRPDEETYDLGDRFGESHLDAILDRLADSIRAGRTPPIEEILPEDPRLRERLGAVLPAIEFLESFRKRGASADSSSGAVRPPSGEAGPERLGEFRVLRELGRGGMGVVYEALQEPLGRRVALKILPFQALTDDRILARFQREACAAASLDHPNIVSVYGAGAIDGIHFYAMQFVEGEGLDAVIREVRELVGGAPPAERRKTGRSSSIAIGLLSGIWEPAAEGEPRDGGRTEREREPRAKGVPPPDRPPARSLPEAERPRALQLYYRGAARLILQAAEGLAYAHSRGVLHRDLKPSNILVDESGRALLADFGLAKTDGSDDITRSGEVCGTLRYLAPERLEGRGDERSDVYGLGVTLYELLVLDPAFPDSQRTDLLLRISRGELAKPRALRRDIPLDLERIVLGATAREPESRYGSSEELAGDLRRFLAGKPVSARPPGLARRAGRLLARRRRLAACLLTLLVGGAAIAAWLSGVHFPDGPQHFVAVDIDRDGDVDLVTANALSNSATVLLNDGAGGFSVERQLGLAGMPTTVSCADLDGDGVLDLAFSGFDSRAISLLLARGSLAFERRLDIPVGAPLNCVLARDLHSDGAGALDLLASARDNRLLVFGGEAGLGVSAPISHALPAPPNLIATADLDGDGALDGIMTHSQDAAALFATLIWGAEAGTFGEATRAELSASPWGVAVADLDGDKDLDLAFVSPRESHLDLVRNEGGRRVSREEGVPLPDVAQGIAAADLDGDSFLDIAVAGGTAHVSILRGDGSGHFSTPEPLSAGDLPAWVEAADLDRDGDLDLVVANFGSSDLFLYRNDGKARFAVERKRLWSLWRRIERP